MDILIGYSKLQGREKDLAKRSEGGGVGLVMCGQEGRRCFLKAHQDCVTVKLDSCSVEGSKRSGFFFSKSLLTASINLDRGAAKGRNELA